MGSTKQERVEGDMHKLYLYKIAKFVYSTVYKIWKFWTLKKKLAKNFAYLYRIVYTNLALVQCRKLLTKSQKCATIGQICIEYCIQTYDWNPKSRWT